MSIDNGSTMSLPIDDNTTMVVSHDWPCPLLSVCYSVVFVQENVMCQLTLLDNGSTMSLPIDDDTTMVVSREWPCPLLSVVIP